MPTSPVPQPYRPLTPSQVALARLCGEGLSYADLAARLGCGKRTARERVERLAVALSGEGSPYLRVCLYGAWLIGTDAARAA